MGEVIRVPGWMMTTSDNEATLQPDPERIDQDPRSVGVIRIIWAIIFFHVHHILSILLCSIKRQAKRYYTTNAIIKTSLF